MHEQLNQNLSNIGIWKRIFFMLVFVVVLKLAGLLLWTVVFLHTASTLLTGSPMDNLLHFGRQLSLYLYQIQLFLTFCTDQMPFPFAAWNGAESQSSQDRNGRLK
jgi:hypothetical protein